MNEKILGIKVTTKSKKEILQELEKDIKNNKRNILFNANPLIICNFYRDKKMVNEINKESLNIPDGFGTVLASKLKHGQIKERIAGIEMFDELCKLSLKTKSKIFIYGAKEENLDLAIKNIEKKYKNINICGYINGYIHEEDALKTILKATPDFLFVALGSPKQENFIIKNKQKFKDIKVIMPTGGTIDVYSGKINRAPSFYQKTHTEWLYRMIKEPKRFKQIFTLIKFVNLVIFKNNCYNESGDQ